MSSPVMPVMPLKRVEVWTDTVCNSGVRQSVVPVVAGTLTEELVNSIVSRRLSLVTTRYADVDDLVVRRVLRLTWSDDTYLEMRINEIQDASGGDGLVRLTALDIIYDLAEQSALISQTVNNVVQYAFEISGDSIDLMDAWLPSFTPSYIPTGTASIRGNITIQVNNDTPLALTTKIVDAASLAVGGYYEWYLTRNGTTQYEWNVARFNATVAKIDVRSAKNLLSTNRRVQRLGNFTNRIVPIGSDGGTHGGAWWKVTAVSANTYIEITEISGLATNPILNDDQFNTTFYWFHEDGVSHQITDTDEANKRLYMASTTGIAVGEWGRIAYNSSGDYLPYLDHPTSQASYGVRIGIKTFDQATHTNFVKNANLSDWSGSLPTNWTSPSYADPTKVTTTGYWLTGGQSARMTGGTTSDFQSTGTMSMTAGTQITYTVRFRLDAFASSAAFGYVQFTNPQTAATENVGLDGSDPDAAILGAWCTVTRTYSITSTGSKTWTFYAYHQTGAGTDVYIDSLSVTFTSGEVDFVNGSGAALLWLKAAQYLDLNDAPPTSYEVNLIDLYRLDPTLYSSMALSLGGYVTLADTELGLTAATQLRVIKVESNLIDPAQTKLTLATNAEQFTRLLTAA